MDTQEKLLKGFIEPQPDYRPVTMWFVNDTLTEDELTTQLETFKSKGVNELFFNVTGGFPEDYLNDHYFEMIKHTVAECKRLGLSFWIYDEYEFPSGIAGGKLIRDYPELRAKMLTDTPLHPVLGPKMRINREYIRGKFEKAYYFIWDEREAGAFDVTDEVTVEECGDGFYVSYVNTRGCAVQLHVMSSKLQANVLSAAVGAKFSFGQEGYIDPLREEAMRGFIDSTHEKYKEAVGDEFGKTVKGLFTDEVCVGDPHELGHDNVPWNDEMKQRFFDRYGYDITPWLYTLVEQPVTPREKQVRYQFWRLLTERVRDAHIKQVYEWCDKEGLLYTGHFDGEESMLWSMHQSGDIFDLMEWLHVPGIDSIFSRTNIESEAFNTAGKVLASCARYFKRDRTLCETYTGSSFRLRFDEMRRIANRLMVLGANMIQYMGSHYSMDNQRKSWKPSFNYNNTMFERLDLFGDYVSRIQYMSAQTKTAGRVLVMCPQAGVYTNFDGHEPIFGWQRNGVVASYDHYEKSYVGTVNALLELNIEYDMFSDSMAAKVEAKDGKAELFGAQYEVVLIPNADDTTSDVIAMADRLRKIGVKVVFIDALPSVAVDLGCEVSPYGKTPESGEVSKIDENLYFFAEPMEGKTRGKNDDYKRKLWEVIGKEYRTLDICHDGGIYTGLRSNGSCSVVFMCNDTDEKRDASIAWKPGMQLLDPATGKSTNLKVKDGRAVIPFDPYQFYILLSESAEEIPADTAVDTVPVRELPADCCFRANDGNILAARWRFAPYAYNEEAIVVPEDQDWIELNAEGDMPARYNSPDQTGLLVFDFDVEAVPEKVRLIAEYQHILCCELNGARIDDKWSKCRMWGPHDADLEVASLLQHGKNRLSVVFTTPDWSTRFFVPFVQMRGAFETDGKSILNKRKGYLAQPINEQGHPRVCGSGSYFFKTNLTAEEAEAVAAVSIDSLDAAELIVNGVSAGTALWKPFRYQTAGLFKEGENVLEFKMTLPMHNLFCTDGDEMPIGLTGAPVLEMKK